MIESVYLLEFIGRLSRFFTNQVEVIITSFVTAKFVPRFLAFKGSTLELNVDPLSSFLFLLLVPRISSRLADFAI